MEELWKDKTNMVRGVSSSKSNVTIKPTSSLDAGWPISAKEDPSPQNQRKPNNKNTKSKNSMTKGIFAKFRRTLSICFNFILACCFEVLPLFAITTTQYVEYAEAKANAQAAMGRGCGRSCSRNSSKSKNCKNNNNSGNRSCCKEHNSHNMKINNPNKAKRGSIGCIENLTKTNNEVHSTTAAYKRRLSEPKNQEPPPQQVVSG
ncbi:unnamed protein product [Ceratitis capitata]|uniref:(Mediterranean fruit fly) hypothetical protein n=1 Tax=Ceratitis capitata TaxID=7213 RepID=A0A811UHM2_CERCA|nr:unnamed protein product [Ceratitis capitata]